MKELLGDAAARAARYLTELDRRSVVPSPEAVARLQTLGGPLPENPSAPAEILALLDDIGSPATVATTARRYFGFVIGGSVPASLVANWLAGAWDQNACMQVMSPVAAKAEEIVRDWTLDLLGLPPGSGMGFVTCTTTANFCGLAAARSALLERAGWNVEEDGLFGAPAIRVVVGEEVHVSVLKALSMVGLGRSRVTRLPTDGQGRMRLMGCVLLMQTRSFVFKQGTSIRERSIRQKRSANALGTQGPGSTLMELSDYGRRFRRSMLLCSRA